MRWPDPLPPDRHLAPDPVATQIATMLAVVGLLLVLGVAGLIALFGG